MRCQLFLLVACMALATCSAYDWKNKVQNMLKYAKVNIFDKAAYILGDKRSHQLGKPWFCHKLDCPAFQVVGNYTNKKDGFEERCYPETAWVMTSKVVDASENDIETRDMFMKLFKYIQGENEKQEKIEMTVPVFTYSQLKKDDPSKRYISMHFFVPPTQEKNIPKPTRDDVTVMDVKADCYYVRSFGGWVMSFGNKIMDEEKKIHAALKKNNLNFEARKTMTAGYDSPFRLFNRHNEVWVAKRKTMDSDCCVPRKSTNIMY